MYEDEHIRAIYEEAFGQAIAFAVDGLHAERVIVAYSGNGRLHNLDAAHLWTSEPISLTILSSLVEAAVPRVFVDILKVTPGQPTSVVLTGIISVLYMPIRAHTGEVCGLYYMDNRIHSGAFYEKDLKQLEAVVTGRLEPLLQETGACRPMTWDLLQKTCWI